MENIGENLLTILNDEIVIHQRLSAAMEKKRLAIVGGKITELEEALDAEYELIENLTAREKDRAELMNSAAAEWKVAEIPFTLRIFIAQMPDEKREVAEAIEAARVNLKTAFTQLQIKTRQIAELLKASMDHVHAYMNLLTNFGETKTYDRHGKAGRPGARLLDRSA